MKDLVKEFRQGLVLQVYEAEKNVFIWQNIADEVDFLNTQQQDTKLLYSYMQLAAQTNFVLALGKMFDKPKNYPTKCIMYFLREVELNAYKFSEIVKKTSIEQMLIKFGVSKELLSSLHSGDYAEFPKRYAEYYRTLYQASDMQSDIDKVKIVRDKVVAHNEAIQTIFLDFDVIKRLLKFATEIVCVFEMAYSSTVLESKNAERNAEFVKSTIKLLKCN